MPGPPTADDVRAFLGLVVGAGDRPALDAATAAAVAYVVRVRPDVTLPPPGDDTDPGDWPWPADVSQGTVQLAALTYQRRGNPQFAGQFDQGGVATLVPRLDPLVQQYLGVGRYADPRVG